MAKRKKSKSHFKSKIYQPRKIDKSQKVKSELMFKEQWTEYEIAQFRRTLSSREERREFDRLLKRAKKKETRKEFRSRQEAARQIENKEYKNAQKINKELNFASSKISSSANIGKYLHPMLQELSGKDNINAGDENEYFKISEDYNGNPADLFKYVVFRKLPNTETINRYWNRIEEDDHISEEKYNKFAKQWVEKSLETASKKYNRDYDFEFIEDIEYIMNTSAAWHLAKKGAYDSDQVLDRWTMLYNSVKDAQATGNDDLIDKLVQHIQNERHSLDWIVNWVDSKINSIIKKG